MNCIYEFDQLPRLYNKQGFDQLRSNPCIKIQLRYSPVISSGGFLLTAFLAESTSSLPRTLA